MSDDLRGKLVESATSVIIELLEQFDVLFVIPPGSSRIEVVFRACKILSSRGISVDVVTYREPGSTREYGVEYFESKLYELLKKETRYKLIVVPRDTTTAILIARNLKKTGLVDSSRVCFLNIAEVYGREISDVEKHLVLDYNHIKKELEDLEFQLAPGYGGISLTLVGRGDAKACNVIKSLSPEKTKGALNVIRELVGKPPHKPSQYLVSILISALYIFIEYALTLKPEIKLGLRVSRDIVLSIARILMGSKRSDFKDLIVDLLVKSKNIAPLLEQELYEGVLDSIASYWGLTIDEFKTLIKNLAKLVDEEIGTVEDVESIKNFVEERLRIFEERFKKIEEEVGRLEANLRAVYALQGVYRDVNENPYIRVEDGKFYIKLWSEKYELATTKTYEDLASEVANKLLSNGIVVVEGSSGIGKSTLAHYVATKIMLKSREEFVKYCVYVVSSLTGDPSLPRTIVNLVERLRDLGERLIIIYDPIPPEVYAKTSLTASVSGFTDFTERDVEFLLEIHNDYKDTVSILIVLPKHLFIHVKEYSRAFRKDLLNLLETHTVNFDEKIRRELYEFVTRVLTVYSECQNVDDLAKSICSEFKESHALVAKQAGLLLKARNCIVRDLQDFISEAKGSSKVFISTIVRERLGLLKVADSVREKQLKKYAFILAVRVPFLKVVPFGEFIVTPALMSHLLSFTGMLGDDEIEKNHDWLSLRNEDLVEEALLEVLSEAGKVTPELTIPQSEHDSSLLLLSKWGDKIWSKILDSIDNVECLRRLCYIIGSTPFELASPLRFKDLYELFIDKASSVKNFKVSKTCRELDKLLVTNEYIPILNSVLLLNLSLMGIKTKIRVEGEEVDVCDLVREALAVYGNFYIRGWRSFNTLSPYALGLALISMDESMCHEDVARLLHYSLSGGLLPLHPQILRVITLEITRRSFELNQLVHLPLLTKLYSKFKEVTVKPELVDYLLRHSERTSDMKPWMMALLVNAICDLLVMMIDLMSALKYLDKAYHLVGKIKQHDEQLGLLVETILGASKLIILRRLGDLDRAIGMVENVEKRLRRLEESMRHGMLSNELVRFLEFISPVEPKETLRLIIEETQDFCTRFRADVYILKGLADKNFELLKKAEEIFFNLATKRKEYCDRFSLELRRLVINVLACDLCDEPLKELENLWKSVSKTLCFHEQSSVFSTLIVVKATLGNILEKDLLELIKYLELWNPVESMLVKLVMGVLAIMEKPDFMEVASTLKNHMRPDVYPLFLLERGLQKSDYTFVRDKMAQYLGELFSYIDSDTIEILEKYTSERDFKNMLNELDVLLYSLKVEKALDLINEHPDLADVLEPRFMFELLAPATSLGALALLLNALAEGDFKLARAHALFLSHITKNYLFNGLYRALNESERASKLTEEAKRCLAKLVLFHFM